MEEIIRKLIAYGYLALCFQFNFSCFFMG